MSVSADAEAPAPAVKAPAVPSPAATTTLAAAQAANVAPSRAVVADPIEPADPLRPLSADERTRFAAGDRDEPIPVEIHYIQSNETRHDLFFPFLEQLGGAFVGVGSDQSFTMAAAARAELLIMMDIDHRVVDLHQIYAVLIPEAHSPRALVDAFESDAQAAVLARLEDAFADRTPAERRRLLQGYRASRETVLRHLHRVIDRRVDGEPASWLSDPAMFEHLQTLYRSGRVRVLPGNLAGESSMQTIGAVTRDLGIPVRALYLSNAEEYFMYTPQFVANIQALPVDERSIVLRTIYAKTWEHADLWAYQVQSAADFVERLGDRSRASGRKAMLRHAVKDGVIDHAPGPKGLSLLAMERALTDDE
ncbi:MAG: hypothetical protein AAF799_19810 [Myxococcota bacterium]